MPFLCKIQIQ
uniref:Uncharacterized protein n=1 Tax=Anguilla anguilla TaxID=7936 RepID=A0A0E9U9N2_ANGAN